MNKTADELYKQLKSLQAIVDNGDSSLTKVKGYDVISYIADAEICVLQALLVISGYDVENKETINEIFENITTILSDNYVDFERRVSVLYYKGNR